LNTHVYRKVLPMPFRFAGHGRQPQQIIHEKITTRILSGISDTKT